MVATILAYVSAVRLGERISPPSARHLPRSNGCSVRIVLTYSYRFSKHSYSAGDTGFGSSLWPVVAASFRWPSAAFGRGRVAVPGGAGAGRLAGDVWRELVMCCRVGT